MVVFWSRPLKVTLPPARTASMCWPSVTLAYVMLLSSVGMKTDIAIIYDAKCVPVRTW